jgi:hypothetical protein
MSLYTSHELCAFRFSTILQHLDFYADTSGWTCSRITTFEADHDHAGTGCSFFWLLEKRLEASLASCGLHIGVVVTTVGVWDNGIYGGWMNTTDDTHLRQFLAHDCI